MRVIHTIKEGFSSRRGWTDPSQGGIRVFRAFLLVIALWGGMSVATPASAAQIGESNLSVHGYLSQAYANSSGGQVLGIPGDGTTDYRTAALLFRYRMSPQGTFVLQLFHERLGESPVQEEETVEMDWVFYQHQLLDSLSIKVGKIPLPNGIYNEIRDVGTILPFYRPPSQFYGEGSFSSESIDGVVLSHSIGIGNGWELQADVYGGEWEFVYVVDGVVTPARSKSAFGGEIWLQTPVEGLRFGIGGYRSTDHDVPVAAPGEKQYQKDIHASLDADFEQFLFQAEYRRSESKNHTFTDYYGLAGIKLFGKVGLYVLAEIATLDLPTLVIPGFDLNDIKLYRDYAVGLNYKFGSDVVLKVEGHQLKTLNSEDPVIPIFMDPIKVKYYIVSLSTSF